jgi:hypothetical protein
MLQKKLKEAQEQSWILQDRMLQRLIMKRQF